MTIEIKNLNKQFSNILAVKNINFKINKGSIVGLLGPNGCGKTTTILLASHNMNEVERLCNEVMMMKNGSIIDKGTCSSLIKKRNLTSKHYFYLTKSNNLKEAGKNLYKTLRKIKKKKFKSIAIIKIPDNGIGRAINDSLRKAATN